MKLKPCVIIGFSTYKHPTFVSKLIRYFDNKEYTHVYTRFVMEDEKSVVYQAMIDDDPVRDYYEFKQDNHIIKEYAIFTSELFRNKALQYCQDNYHKKYSVMQLLGIWLARNFLDKNPFWHREHEHICLKYVEGALDVLGFKVKNAEKNGPSYLDDFLSRLAKIDSNIIKL